MFLVFHSHAHWHAKVHIKLPCFDCTVLSLTSENAALSNVVPTETKCTSKLATKLSQCVQGLQIFDAFIA